MVCFPNWQLFFQNNSNWELIFEKDAKIMKFY